MNSDLIVSIDLASLGINEQLSPQLSSAIQTSMQTSLAIIRDRWQTSVQNKLNSTRSIYLQGLSFENVTSDSFGFTGAVVLNGKFPNMLEKGFTAFDIKSGFSKSENRVQKKNGGWYLTVPIRHSTPGAFMYGRAMPKDIYKAARTLSNRSRLSYPGAGDVSWTGYQHKNKIHDGLTRIIKSYQKANQSQYMTFRRVSDKSDPRSWQHPGFSGVKVAESLLPFAEKTAKDLLTVSLSNIK